MQYGTASIASAAGSGTATITAVDTANATVVFLGFSEDTNTDPGNFFPRVSLTNATTVTATRSATPVPAVVLSFVVIEWAPGILRSIQTGTIALAAVSTTATITAVDTTKTLLIFNNAQASTGQSDALFSRLTLTNGTTITATRNTNFSSITAAYVALEFF